MIEKFKNKTVGFISLGCDKNRVDLEKMIFKIRATGFQIVSDPSLANIIIINTCAFLESARSEAIENILEMGEFKNKNLEKLIVTGCLNELNYSDLSSSLPEVDAFVNIKDNDKIVELIYSLYNENISQNNDFGRVLTTPKHYSYLKISDGCNNFCSYCLIPYIRGRYKSESMENILKEAEYLISTGVKELILVAQDVTKYGVDIYKQKTIVPLIRKLSEIEGLQQIRLLYCYPEELDDDLIEEIKNNPKVLKYIDIPLQHVSNKILKSMNRRSSKESIYKLFSKLKTSIPDIVLRTTFILGFPGETEEDFNEILDFLREFKLDNVGFFKYSREEGTRAFDFENQVDEETKEERLQLAYDTQYQIIEELSQKLLNSVQEVVIDEVTDDYSIGRYYGQCPMIDSVIIVNEKLSVGQTYKVKITNKLDYDYEGVRL